MICAICKGTAPDEIGIDGLCPECYPFDEPSEDRMSPRYLKRKRRARNNTEIGGRDGEIIRDCR